MAQAFTTLSVRRTQDGLSAELSPISLRVLEGSPGAGATFKAKRERITIGTHESADLILEDRTVSRFHCELAVEDGRVVIRDLGSTNGTVVDGVSVFFAPLSAPCTLTLGNTRLRFELGEEPIAIALAENDRFGSMLGRSTAMRAVFALFARAAESDATVLLEGETGTGKEAAAESIHNASKRKSGPFLVVDCGAIPPHLIENELFGHERGAFTGATGEHEGAFAAASGGTIFLDEIGELPADLQPKLLRALEKREVKRLGSTQYRAIDVRVIAATNRNLRAEVNAKTFRADLYYRLAVLEVRLPSLRERKDDIPLLVEHTLESMSAASLPEADVLRSETCRADMARHPWPGNVRELRNYVERCLALRASHPLAQEDAPAIENEGSLKAARGRAKEDFERRFLEELLAKSNNNVSAAARAAGIDRKYLYRLLWRHGLR